MSTEGPQPAYLRAQEAIIEMLGRDGRRPGSRIPSERTLAEQFGISRMTVRKAVENLVRMGTLERDSTSGTRVAVPGVVRNLAARTASSMTDMVRRAGARPGTRLLRFESLQAEGAVGRSLMLPRGAPVIGIRRLRLADDVPFCVETSYLPASIVPGMAAADLTNDASLYVVLRERYGLHPAARQGRIRIVAVDPEDAELLAIATGTSVLEYRSTVSGPDLRPIEHVVSINHPQLVAFTVEESVTTVGGPVAAPLKLRSRTTRARHT